MISTHAPRRSRSRRLALAALAGLALVTLAQCRSVPDRISGIERAAPRSLSMRSRCARHCNVEFEEALRGEATRYRAARRACARNESCLRKEERAHERNLKELVGERLRCKRACYNEGAGGVEA